MNEKQPMPSKNEIEKKIIERAQSESQIDFDRGEITDNNGNFVGKIEYDGNAIQTINKIKEEKINDPEFRKKIENELIPKTRIHNQGEENFDGSRNGEYNPEEDQIAA